MSNIDKQAVQAVADLKAGYTLGHADVAILNELARIALASLEAEKEYKHHSIIAEQLDHVLSSMDATDHQRAVISCAVDRLNNVSQLLQASPSALLVPETLDYQGAKELFNYLMNEEETNATVNGWNACRAAMLQGEPVSNSDELPLDYLQGHKDGLEWAAQLAEANHPQTGDWLYDDPIDLARAIRKGPDMPTVQGGSSPVIPDDIRRMDWLVSKTVDVREPMVYGSHSIFWSQTTTDEEDDYHATKLREQIDAAMAAENAAPQQEVTQALAKGMERYGDAMQKLADSDD